MLESFYFVVVGIMAGLAYLARTKHQDFLSYGLALLGIAAFLSGVIVLVAGDGNGDGGSGNQAFATMLSLMRNVTLGGGVSFLIYLGTIEGLRYYRSRRAKVELESIRVEARNEPEGRVALRTSPR